MVLLQEMQDHFAESLRIISSILLIKGRTVRLEEARLHLQDALSARVVDRCYSAVTAGSEPGTTIELDAYLSRLCETLEASMIGDRRSISLKVHAGGGAIPSD